MGNNKSYEKVVQHPNFIANIKRNANLAKEKKKRTEEIYNLSPKCCKYCSNKIRYDDRFKVFCNRSCSGRYNNANRTFNPLNDSRTKETCCKICSKKIEVNIRATNEKVICKECKDFIRLSKVKYKVGVNKCKFCSRDVTQPKRICISCRDCFQNVYSFRCRFKFSLNNFPEEFDFNLIKEYGWYKAKNKGNNLDGVSRDHKFSVISGFKNNIDPILIAHPANCELLLQRNNSKKRHNSSITLKELMEDVLNFEKKYNYNPEVLIYIKTLNNGDVV